MDGTRVLQPKEGGNKHACFGPPAMHAFWHSTVLLDVAWSQAVGIRQSGGVDEFHPSPVSGTVRLRDNIVVAPLSKSRLGPVSSHQFASPRATREFGMSNISEVALMAANKNGARSLSIGVWLASGSRDILSPHRAKFRLSDEVRKLPKYFIRGTSVRRSQTLA